MPGMCGGTPVRSDEIYRQVQKPGALYAEHHEDPNQATRHGGWHLKSLVRSALILTSFAGFILQTACTCEAPLRLRLGMMRSAGCSPLALAIEQKIFQDQNLAVEVQTLDDVAAFSKTQFDIVCMNLAELLVQQDNYQVVTIPSVSHGADVLVARKDAGTDLNDLKGARIGVPPISMGHLLLRQALAQHQLTPEDFTVLPLDSADLDEALQKSEIQLAVTAPPVSLRILQNLNSQVLFRSTDYPDRILDTVAIRAEVLMKWPQLAVKWEKAWQNLEAWRADQEETALSFMAKSSGLPVTTLQQDYKFLTLAAQRDYLAPEGRLLPLIKEIQSSLVQAGSLKIRREPQRYLFIPTPK
jgi:NitT/TauT family transport system substrate-binding protein